MCALSSRWSLLCAPFFFKSSTIVDCASLIIHMAAATRKRSLFSSGSVPAFHDFSCPPPHRSARTRVLNIGVHNRRHNPPHSFLLTLLRASLSHFLLLLVMGDFTMIYHHHCHISAFLSPLSSCASRSSCGGIQDSFVVAPAVIRRHIIVSVLIAVAIEFRVAGILLRTSPSHLEACKSDAKKCDCAYTGRHQFFFRSWPLILAAH